MHKISPKQFLYILAIIKFILPILLFNNYYQPHRDEFLYLAEGDHLAWGYLEVPPLLSSFAWLTNVLGGSMFWIKLWPNLFGVFTMLLCGNIIISLGGKKFALLLGLMPLMIGGYLRLFYLLQPNFLDVFFWTLMAYSLFYFIQTKENRWLYLFGSAVGLGMMSKYSTAFYALSLLVGLLISRHRHVFLSRHLYIAGLVALIIFLPNLYWQYAHNFPVVNHMEELQEEQLQFISPMQFVLSQVMMLLFFVFIWIGGVLWMILSQEGKKFRLFAWAYIGVILILIVFHGKDYYALGAYPILFALGGFYLEKVTEQKLVWLRYVMVFVPTGFTVFIMPLLMPIAKPEQLAAYYKRYNFAETGAMRWEDQQDHELPQDFADMIGWRELTEHLAKAYHALPKEEQANTLIYARGYFTAGALNYYGDWYDLPEVYSNNASFLFWMPDHFEFKNLLMVARNAPPKEDDIYKGFERVIVLDSVFVPMFRENGTKFILFENASDSVKTYIEKTIRQEKAQFNRSIN